MQIGYVSTVEIIALSHGVDFVIFDFRIMIYDWNRKSSIINRKSIGVGSITAWLTQASGGAKSGWYNTVSVTDVQDLLFMVDDLLLWSLGELR